LPWARPLNPLLIRFKKEVVSIGGQREKAHRGNEKRLDLEKKVQIHDPPKFQKPIPKHECKVVHWKKHGCQFTKEKEKIVGTEKGTASTGLWGGGVLGDRREHPGGITKMEPRKGDRVKRSGHICATSDCPGMRQLEEGGGKKDHQTAEKKKGTQTEKKTNDKSSGKI